MPATFLLATEDPSLQSAWASQLPPGRPVLSLSDSALSHRLPPGLPVVVILDAIVCDRVPVGLEKCPTIVVGEPHTTAYEELHQSGRARQRFTYEQSRTRLREIVPLIEELAERNAALDLLMEKMRRSEGLRAIPPAIKSHSWADTPEIWDFLEGAVENLASRERLLGEFRRASRYLLRASHTVFFLREESGFRADRGASFLPLDEPIVGYLAAHPLVLDGVEWPGPPDPVAELSVRNRLALWGARLLVPLHENGHLLGLIACGVRDDGQSYDEGDKSRAVFVARLLRQFLAGSTQLGRLAMYHERAHLAEKYLPQSLILSADEDPPRSVPLAVRALIGRVRRVRDSRRISPSADQPFRASAGYMSENNGTWAFWEEASGELFDRAQRSRVERLDLLRELALTLNHEIGNSLVSLTALRHAGDSVPAALREAVKIDVTRLETLNRELNHMAGLVEAHVESVDLRATIQEIGARCSVHAEVGPDPVVLAVAPRLIEFALESILRTVTANRGELGTRELAIQLRATGAEDKLTALVSIKGKTLELEGILPEATPDSVPNQGRMGVFIAKEVIRLHSGSIHAGPGMEGTEILISLRKW